MKNRVCIKSGETVKNVLRKEADKLVLSGDWKYCPRSEWKEKVRGPYRASTVVKTSKVTSDAPAPRNSARRAGNLKGKARKVAVEAVEAEETKTVTTE